MKMKKTTALVAVTASLALALTGCGATDAGPGSSDESKGSLAMSFGGLDIQIWVDMIDYMKPIVEDAGYEFITDDPKWDIQTQVSDWETWIQRGDVKAIMGYPVRVNVHDFPDPRLGKANPYGVYDVANDDGWVSVGTDHDTAAFAVETIRRWFHQVGAQAYPGASKLLVCADGGGSTGYRLRAWKTQLAALATETGLTITVCHLPPGTSKWNKRPSAAARREG